MTRYAEQGDMAQAITESYTEDRIAAARLRNKPEQVQNPDGSWPHTECIDCDEIIPEGRLNLGKVRCVDCQSYLEEKR